MCNYNVYNDKFIVPIQTNDKYAIRPLMNFLLKYYKV